MIRNELNNKISNSPYAVNYYCGIRNNKVIKLSKDIYEDTESTKTLKLHTLSEEIRAQKEFLINSLEKIRSEFINLTSSSQITINNNNEVIKTLTETVVLVHNRTKDLYNMSDEKFTFNYAILHMLERIGLNRTDSNLIKETLKKCIDKYRNYKIT